jgi:uncharacterized protein (TIGR00159 family)
MNPLAILTNLRFQDVIDILFLTFVAYHLYLWFWGTKAFKALVGLLVLGIIFTVSRIWGLFLTTWVFQILWQVLVVMLIILFQSEIRQVLERVNPLKVIGLRTSSSPEDWILDLAEGVFSLAKRKIGALIILERLDRVEEFMTGGFQLDGRPNSQLLMSVFQKESPLHDGAMLIRGGKVAQVACYLPLSSAEGLPKEWGTRHRAALGLSERCDAWVLVVSEERGEVALVREGQMIRVEKPERLTPWILEAIAPPQIPKTTWWRDTFSFLTRRWPVKLGALGFVSVLWLLLAGQQDFEKNLRIPLDVINLPPKMEIVDPMKPEVELTVRGLRKDASTLSEKNVQAELDLSLARFGNTLFRITRDQIILPNDRIYIVNIRPPQIEFKFREDQ